MSGQNSNQDSGLKTTTEPKLHLKKVDLKNIDYQNLAKIKNTPKPVKKEDSEDLIVPEDFQPLESEKLKPTITPDLKSKKPETKNNFWLIVLISIVVFSLVFVAISFFNRTSNTKPVAKTTASIDSDFFTVIKEFGEVSYKENGDFVALDVDQKNLKNGSFIKVGNGNAHVLFVDGSLLSIDSNSQIQINYQNNNTSVVQLQGNTWHRVNKLNTNNSYTVTTPQAIATSESSKFGVELAKEPLNLGGFYTIQGRVKVSQIDKDKKAATNNEITAPQFLEIKPQDQPESINKGNLLAQENQGRWYARNREIDKLFDASESLNIPDFLKNIRESRVLQQILLENKSNTKKDNCLELLDQSGVIKPENGFIKITTPANNSEFKITDTIKFSVNGLNPCSEQIFEEKNVKWFLNGKALEFATGYTAEQKNLEAGDYTVTVKTSAASKEFTDTINFKVIGPVSSSSSSSQKPSSKSSSKSSSSTVSSSSSSSNPPLPSSSSSSVAATI